MSSLQMIRLTERIKTVVNDPTFLVVQPISSHTVPLLFVCVLVVAIVEVEPATTTFLALFTRSDIPHTLVHRSVILRLLLSA